MRLLRELDVKRPRHYSNSAAVVAIDLQSVESRVLERKLFFCSGSWGMASHVLMGERWRP